MTSHKKFSKDDIDTLSFIKFESDRLWQYFEYHAKQRIETFRFFIILSGIIMTGAATVLARFQLKYLKVYLFTGFTLGILLILFSIAFWLLDYRNNTMIKKSRQEIISLEKSDLISHKIFTNVNKHSGGIKFHHCFWIVFVSFIIVGFKIAMYSFSRLYF